MRPILCLSLLAAACAPGASTAVALRPVSFDSGPQCLQLCTELGLKMSALVVVEGKTACVCQPPGGPAASAGTAAAATSAVIDKQKHEEQKKASDEHNLLQEQQLQQEQQKPR